MSEFLGARKIQRSAYAEDTATPTTIYLGVCQRDNRPVRFEWPLDMGKTADLPCPDCTLPVTAERLVAVTITVTCDGSCRSAHRSECICGCGGMNHGLVWMAALARQFGAEPGSVSTYGAVVDEREVLESELAKWRDKQARVEAKREARREAETRRQRATFERWAADHQDVIRALAPYRHNESTPAFLADLAVPVTDGWNGKPKPLTEAQEAAALRVVADVGRRTRLEAERKAAARPAPEGKGVPISGEIVKVSAREGYAGGIDYRAIVKCDGYAVQVTVPRAVVDWAWNARSEVIHSGWRPSYRTDYYGIGERWTTALRGVKVQFQAEIKRSDRDESFGFAKRPTKVQFQAPESERQAEAG
jgi:hypothetical protein